MSTDQKAPLKLPDNFNPGIISKIKRRNMGFALLLSLLIPGAGHIYTDQKKLAIFFFLLGIGAWYYSIRFSQYYILGIFEAIILIHTIRSVKTYLFRKRYVYLGGVHAWDYCSW